MNATELQPIPIVSDATIALRALGAHARQLAKIAAEFGIRYMPLSVDTATGDVRIVAALDTDEKVYALYSALISAGAVYGQAPHMVEHVGSLLVGGKATEWLDAQATLDGTHISFYGPHREKTAQPVEAVRQ